MALVVQLRFMRMRMRGVRPGRTVPLYLFQLTLGGANDSGAFVICLCQLVLERCRVIRAYGSVQVGLLKRIVNRGVQDHK